MKFEFPLQWNPRIPRTDFPIRSRFGSRSASGAGIKLESELKKLGGTDIIISSNMRTKIDGGFYAIQQRIDDSGVCIYFKLKGKDKCFACDKWNRPEDNIWALALNVAAIRGMERWGGSNFMDGLFTGFAAIEYNKKIQYFSECKSKEEAKEKYKELCKKLHPDTGGNAYEFQEMAEEYRKIIGVD